MCRLRMNIAHIRSRSDERPDRANEQNASLRHALALLRSSKGEVETAVAGRIEAHLAADRGARGPF